MMSVIVEDAGIFTTIQDSGRTGYEKFGVSPSGPMDYVSFVLANILVGNSRGQCALEMTLKGARLRFESDCVIAVTGADMSPTLNGRECGMYRAVQVKAGDVLSMGFAKDGCRTYIAFHGGLDVPAIMGSRSVSTYNHIGRKVARGDVLGFIDTHRFGINKARSITPPPLPKGERTIRVIPGPQDYAFTDEGLSTFLTQPYRVTGSFDRMGYRLEGAKIAHKTDSNIISDGMVTGAVQVPGSGQPIVMMSERQTIGGYTKIACVISADLPLIGQSKEGDVLRFKAVSISEAHEALRQREEYFRGLEAMFLAGVHNYRITVDGHAYNVSVEALEE